MQFSQLIALIATAAAVLAAPSATVTPAPFPPTVPEPGFKPPATKTILNAPSPTLAPGHPIFPLVACNKANFGQPCIGLGITQYNTCFNLPSAFNDSITSVDELFTNVQCHMFIDPNCGNADFYVDDDNTPIFDINSPAIYDHTLSSFFCDVFSPQPSPQ